VTPEELDDLLEYASSAFGGQTFSNKDLDAWMDLIGDQDFATTKQAIRELVRDQGKTFGKPGEVRAQWKLIRDKRRSRQVLPEITVENPVEYNRLLNEARKLAVAFSVPAVTPAELEQARSEISSALARETRAAAHGWDAEKQRLREESLRVDCEHCQAQPGQVCTLLGRPITHAPAHPPRLEKAGLIEPERRRPLKEEQAELRRLAAAAGTPIEEPPAGG
jgi:hypothetical protein